MFERHYYAMRAAVIVIALITVAFSGVLSPKNVAHSLNQARFSAPQRIEQAIWGPVRQGLERLFRPRG